MKLVDIERKHYILATLFLFLIEVLIAIFMEDNFIRSYIGDVLVVILIYTFIRVFLPKKGKGLPIIIFLFAVFVEILQYINIVGLLGLENNRFLCIVIGTVFDYKDVISYLIGTLLLIGYELLLDYKKQKG